MEIKHKIRDKGINVFAIESINFGVVISEIVFFSSGSGSTCSLVLLYAVHYVLYG